MYTRGMTTRNISDTIMDIYGFEVSEGYISDVTDKLLPKIQEWQSRPSPRRCISGSLHRRNSLRYKGRVAYAGRLRILFSAYLQADTKTYLGREREREVEPAPL